MKTTTYAMGTRIVIEGQPVKADNGTFEIQSPFPAQPNGDSYWQFRRIGKNGEPLMSNATSNLRGARASRLDRIAMVVSL